MDNVKKKHWFDDSHVFKQHYYMGIHVWEYVSFLGECVSCVLWVYDIIWPTRHQRQYHIEAKHRQQYLVSLQLILCF